VAKVNAKRQYTSALRREQASQTRMRILDAAQRLFTDRGYAPTTMEAIASEAGVATDTVYASFRNKSGLLRNLLEVRVGGDDSPVALLDREGPRKVRAQETQKRQVAAFASDLADILRGAAAVDPEIASLRAHMQGARYANQREFVSWLEEKGPLRGGMAAEEAAGIVWTLASPEVHGLLRRDRAWSQERYVAWLAETLSRTLLA